MEEHLRRVERGLLWLGIALLLVCMAIVGVRAWELGTDYVSRSLSAGVHVTEAATGGLFVVFCRTCFALRFRIAGSAGAIGGCLAFLFTLVAMIDFQLLNRRASGQGLDHAVAWEAIGYPAVLLLSAYICLWLRTGLVYAGVNPVVLTAYDVRKLSLSRNDAELTATKSVKFSGAEAREDLERLFAGGHRLDNISMLARRWGWSPNTTGSWLRAQPDLDVPPPGRRGERLTVERKESSTFPKNYRSRRSNASKWGIPFTDLISWKRPACLALR